MKNAFDLLEKLDKEHALTKEEWIAMICSNGSELRAEAAKKADALRRSIYGTKVFARGLIEFTNYCRNNCNYCGLRRGNTVVERYRLDDETILSCCETGYELGYRTFVLQGGEDPFYTDDHICALVERIKQAHPDCAVTLSIGEKEHDSYRAYFDAGADRFLLRHETANEVHYGTLHPKEMSGAHRKKCLYDLKEIGYQVGAGFMVGAPFQTPETLAEDFLFLKELNPHMVGIGPFIPAAETPFCNESQGTLEDTLLYLSLIRLMLPHVLLPATTALGTIHPLGRELGFQAGANVVMPNLSPTAVRDKYTIYDNKICVSEEAGECKGCLAARAKSVGYEIVVERGDYL